MALWQRKKGAEGLIHHSDSECVHSGFLAWSDPHSDRPFACHSPDVSITRGQPVEVAVSTDTCDLMRA